MTPDQQKWLKLLGAELRKRLATEALVPEEIEVLLGKLREIEGALSNVTFVSDSSAEQDEPPDEPSREV